MGPGLEEYPCRCGQTHTGSYAYEDWRHHNCFHEGPIWVIEDELGICSVCGKSFTLERRPLEHA